eukprot:2234034-Rhodomonas_salina.1
MGRCSVREVPGAQINRYAVSNALPPLMRVQVDSDPASGAEARAGPGPRLNLKASGSPGSGPKALALAPAESVVSGSLVFPEMPRRATAGGADCEGGPATNGSLGLSGHGSLAVDHASGRALAPEQQESLSARLVYDDSPKSLSRASSQGPGSNKSSGGGVADVEFLAGRLRSVGHC